jgi:uncharacterized SAM-binding protein YcdF (DUF218 family)
VVRRPRFLLPSLLTLTAICLALYFGSGIWLPALGRALVSDDGPAPADAAVVLAGDFTGCRMNGGADLVRKAFVPVVLVSGPAGMYGINEADAATRFITAQGLPADRFVAVRHSATSTRDEARVLLAELAKRQVRRVDVVTSNFHTRRARRMFLDVERERGGGPEIRMVATPDPMFDPESWWHTREGRKVAFLEWTKTITSVVGI